MGSVVETHLSSCVCLLQTARVGLSYPNIPWIGEYVKHHAEEVWSAGEGKCANKWLLISFLRGMPLSWNLSRACVQSDIGLLWVERTCGVAGTEVPGLPFELAAGPEAGATRAAGTGSGTLAPDSTSTVAFAACMQQISGRQQLKSAAAWRCWPAPSAAAAHRRSCTSMCTAKQMNTFSLVNFTMEANTE